MPFPSSTFLKYLSAALCLAATPAKAIVAVPYFTDHMVLQRRMAAPVFGKADVGEKVTVTFRGQTKTDTADATGKWMVKLDPTEAGGPFNLVIDGKNSLTLTDILVGEVWLGSGQSNMAMNMNQPPLSDSAKFADYPQIRLLRRSSAASAWAVCTPTNVLGFSDVEYFFGRNIHLTQKIPVGLIVSAVGGTTVERWLEPDFISKDPILSDPDFRTQDSVPGDLYKVNIAPLVPMAIRGVLWYQGENNEGTNTTYAARFAGLIKGWRKAWGEGDFPFYFVQLASWRALQTEPVQETGWCAIREAQRLTLALPNTAMATAIDLGEAASIHPVNKWELGRRLSLAARALDYGENSLVYSGPMYKSILVEGNKLRLQFNHVGTGLASKDGGALKGFAIAGANDKWSWADAKIENNAIVLSAADVGAPTQARYDWADNPIGNFINKEGLPASSFKTDGAQLPVVLAAPLHKSEKIFRWFRLGVRDLMGRKIAH